MASKSDKMVSKSGKLGEKGDSVNSLTMEAIFTFKNSFSLLENKLAQVQSEVEDRSQWLGSLKMISASMLEI